MTKSRILSLFTAAAFLVIGGCNPALTGGVSTTSQLESINSARILRLYQAFASTVIPNLITTPTGAILYDNSTYYYKAAVSGAVTTISYYTDTNATVSAGTITATNVSPSGATTQTYNIVFNITTGKRPCTNPAGTTFTLTIGPGSSPITLVGAVTENSQSGNFPMTLDITVTNGAITGSATGVAFGSTLSFTNLVGTTTATDAYTLTGSVAVNGSTGTFNENIAAIGSGSLSLNDGTTLNWNQYGTGTLVIPNASGTISVANVDGGQ